MSRWSPTTLRGLAIGLLVCGVVSLAGCAWRPYVVTRGIRLMTGGPTRVHTLVPITTPLRQYRVIEVHWLDNLLPGRVPSDLEQYLNDQLAGQLLHLPSSPTVVRLDPNLPPEIAAPPEPPDTPLLAFEGFIDDYDPGYFGLRLAEVGFNHMVVTVRVDLRDMRTGRVVGAASVTAQDDRATATARTTIRRLARHVHQFVEAGYAE